VFVRHGLLLAFPCSPGVGSEYHLSRHNCQVNRGRKRFIERSSDRVIERLKGRQLLRSSFIRRAGVLEIDLERGVEGEMKGLILCLTHWLLASGAFSSRLHPHKD